MDNIKTIAFYLPQYHCIPENDKWWGKGFTEWTNVKNAKKYHDGQNQPRVPLDENYYNLLDEEVMVWQSKIARENGIYGFCFYHYWFNGHMLLQKPVEKYQSMPSDKKIHYCICWANENWTKAWADRSNEILIAQTYGNKKEWENHFNYLLPFFKDEKYILDDKKRPVFVIYRPEIIPKLKKMLLYWNALAKKNGFPGICFIYQQYSYYQKKAKAKKMFSYHIEYQPDFAWAQMDDSKKSLLVRIYSRLPAKIQKIISKSKHKVVSESSLSRRKCKVFDYDEVWNHILNSKPSGDNSIACAFVDFDNSPRRKENGTYFKNVSVSKFKLYFDKLVDKVINEYNSKFLFIFAWNEWGESAYLEPDISNGFGYLNAIKSCFVEKKMLIDGEISNAKKN